MSVADTDESADAPPADDEPDDSVTKLLEQLAGDVTALIVCETRLAASRHAPQLRRAGRDVAFAALAALALLSAFVLVNAAAVHGLATTMPDWAAPLVLGAAWVAVGVVLALALGMRIRQAMTGTGSSAQDARDAAEQEVRETLERLVPVITKEIALAAVPIAGGVAEGVIDAGEDLLEGADDFVEDIVDDVPGGGVVNQVFDVALAPGRLGVRVTKAFLRLGEAESRADEERESSDRDD